MKRYAGVIVLPMTLCMALSSAASAQTDVYVCTAADGAKAYKNVGVTKGCQKLDLPGLAARRPAPRIVPGKAAPNKAADFPNVDSRTQAARDNERRQLLQDELAAEQKKLAMLQTEFNHGEPARRGDERNYAKYQERAAQMQDDVARSERNIEALQRELGNRRP